MTLGTIMRDEFFPPITYDLIFIVNFFKAKTYVSESHLF